MTTTPLDALRKLIEVNDEHAAEFSVWQVKWRNALDNARAVVAAADEALGNPKSSKWVRDYCTAADEAGERKRVQFPTMLRKMWSGTEVQEWLDKELGQAPADRATGTYADYQKFKSEQAAQVAGERDWSDCPVCEENADRFNERFDLLRVANKKVHALELAFGPLEYDWLDTGDKGSSAIRKAHRPAAAPPQPEPVRVPEALPVPAPHAGTMGAIHERGYAVGWNACCAETIRINAARIKP